jgi:uncharacterized membrane protein YhhN
MRGRAGLLVALSLLFGLGYPLLWGVSLPPEAMIAAKGAGVGLLALAAAFRARGVDGWLLAAVLALGSAGDVLLEIDFAVGAAAFAAGHVAAIVLYWRNLRHISSRRWWVAAALPIAAALIPAFLLRGRPEAVPFAAYALLLGAMAASAWLSRYPRGLVAAGALLFLASDMLIALRMASGTAGLGPPIWLLYYVGQLMIFLGVSTSLPPRERSSGGGGPPKVVEG